MRKDYFDDRLHRLHDIVDNQSSKIHELRKEMLHLDGKVKFLLERYSDYAVTFRNVPLFGEKDFIKYVFGDEIKYFEGKINKRIEVVECDAEKITFQYDDGECYLLDKSTNHAVSLGKLDEESEDE